MIQSARHCYWLFLSVIVIVMDQLSKYFISQSLEFAVPYRITAFFNVILLHNTGTAFSIFSQGSGWQRWFLGGIAVVVSIGIIYWLLQRKNISHFLAAALCLILGGALGNLIDRIRFGFVVDFIQWHYQNYYWPVFNIADSAITVGAVILFLYTFKKG